MKHKVLVSSACRTITDSEAKSEKKVLVSSACRTITDSEAKSEKKVLVSSACKTSTDSEAKNEKQSAGLVRTRCRSSFRSLPCIAENTKSR